VQDELDLSGELVSLKIHKGNEKHHSGRRDGFLHWHASDLRRFSVAPEAQENWITQLSESLSNQAASTGLFMKNPTMDEKLTLAQWCKVLVQRSSYTSSRPRPVHSIVSALGNQGAPRITLVDMPLEASPVPIA
jgi:hypothetical protein